MESLLDKYKQWIRNYPNEGKKVEDYLRLFSYLVPSLLGLSSSSSVASSSSSTDNGTNSSSTVNIIGETLYSCSNLLGLYHDTLLASSESNTNQSHPYPHHRHPPHHQQHRGSSTENTTPSIHHVSSLRWFLSILNSIDVLGEVIATVPWHSSVPFYRRQLYRQRTIVLIEVLRVIAKLYILIHRAPEERIQIEGGQITVPVNVLPSSKAEEESISPSTTKEGGGGWWRGALSGIALPLPKEESIPNNPTIPHDNSSSSSYSFSSSSYIPGSNRNEETVSSFLPYTEFLSQLWQGFRLVFSSSSSVSSSFLPQLTSSSSTRMLSHTLQSSTNTHNTVTYPNSIVTPTVTNDRTGIYSTDLSRSLFLIGEVIYILRPLIYVLVQGGYVRGNPSNSVTRRTWLPLIISLIMDLYASQLTRAAAHIADGDSWSSISSLLPFYGIRHNDVMNTKNNSNIRSSGSVLSLSRIESVQDTLRSSPVLDPYFHGFTHTPSQASEDLLFAALTIPSSSSTTSSSSSTIPLQTVRKTAPVLSTLVRLGLWLKKEPPSLSLKESIELHRRFSYFWYYLLRSPLYETVTVPLLTKTSSSLAWLPILPALVRYGQEVLQYMHEHHFCSSASQ